jgi:hypothetical protein
LRVGVVVSLTGLGYRTYYVGIQPRSCEDDDSQRKEGKRDSHGAENGRGELPFPQKERKPKLEERVSGVDLNENGKPRQSEKRALTPDDEKHITMAKQAGAEEKKNLVSGGKRREIYCACVFYFIFLVLLFSLFSYYIFFCLLSRNNGSKRFKTVRR